MNEFCSFVCLLLVLHGSFSKCTFRDESLFDGTFDFDQPKTSNDYGGYEYGGDTGLIWENHKVYYDLHPDINEGDKRYLKQLLDTVIQLYEEKTCMVFQEVGRKQFTKQVLMINATFDNSCKDITGNVGPGDRNEVEMELFLSRNTDYPCIRDTESLIFHEMGHAMGIIHTQNRDDRENYVIYNEKCVKNKKEYRDQFKMIKKNKKNIKLTYECDSIMHYGPNDYNKYECYENCPCTVLTPKPGTICKYIEPSIEPTDLDWKLINKVQKCPGY